MIGKKVFITGNGNVDLDKKNGCGVRHGFHTMQEVVIIDEYKDRETGRIIRYVCKSSSGLVQFIMPQHVSE